MTDGYTRSISLVKDAAFRKQIVLKLLDVAQTREFESLTNSRKAISPDNASTNENDSNKATLSTVRETICNYVAETINFQVGVNTQYFSIQCHICSNLLFNGVNVVDMSQFLLL